MPESKFISYAHQSLSRKEIKKYAAQYAGVDMAQYIGADEDHFPFLIDDGDTCSICFWEPTVGIMMLADDDPVSEYATQSYLSENAYPIFDSFAAAMAHAEERNWPRKNQLA